jgi:hypothetical protein
VSGDGPPADGSYDVTVVGASPAGPGLVSIEAVVTSGRHKGEVLALTAGGLDVDPLDLLGLPATVSVTAGEPRLTLA